jgi:hypothetical protein
MNMVWVHDPYWSFSPDPCPQSCSSSWGWSAWTPSCLMVVFLGSSSWCPLRQSNDFKKPLDTSDYLSLNLLGQVWTGGHSKHESLCDEKCDQDQHWLREEGVMSMKKQPTEHTGKETEGTWNQASIVHPCTDCQGLSLLFIYHCSGRRGDLKGATEAKTGAKVKAVKKRCAQGSWYSLWSQRWPKPKKVYVGNVWKPCEWCCNRKIKMIIMS